MPDLTLPASASASSSTHFTPSLRSYDAPSFLPSNLPPCASPHPLPLPTYWSENYNSPLRDHNEGVSHVPPRADVVIVGTGMTGLWALYGLVDGLLRDRRRRGGGRDGGGLRARSTSKPFRIHLLESRTFSSGATARNGGHLTALPLLHFTSLREAYGLAETLRMIEHERRSIALIVEMCKAQGWEQDVDLVKGGNVHLFDHKDEMDAVRASLKEARDNGVDWGPVGEYEFLSAEEVHQLYSASPRHLVGALRLPGNTLYPLKFLTKLYQHCLDRTRDEGEGEVEVELFTRCCVDQVEETKMDEGGSGRCKVVTRGKGSIECDYILHCTNAYASHLIPSLSQGPLRIVPTRGQVLSVLPAVSKKDDQDKDDWQGPSRWPTWSNSFSSPQGGQEYYFQRPYPDDRVPGSHARPIILGGSRSAAWRTNFEFGITDDSNIDAEVSTRLRGYLGRQFPDLFERPHCSSANTAETDEDVGAQDPCSSSSWNPTAASMNPPSTGKAALLFPNEWTGIMGFTLSTQPIVGPLYTSTLEAGSKLELGVLKGQFVSAGYSGHGMPRAPGCGMRLAEMVLSELEEGWDGEEEDGWQVVDPAHDGEEGDGKGPFWDGIVPKSWILTEERWKGHFGVLALRYMEIKGFEQGRGRWCSVQ
ncbi:BQ2448_7535 [Microbotryum intermedium]|uniref:BQ2448_7535 protein n=1 Tax=Microbotryum intermedium TaxID=269621 RepID=A0A238FTV4_9BASI|nr:BQ2448_7535 [Microbotryum intermedium]